MLALAHSMDGQVLSGAKAVSSYQGKDHKRHQVSREMRVMGPLDDLWRKEASPQPGTTGSNVRLEPSFVFCTGIDVNR
jgi:hypothetical protein